MEGIIIFKLLENLAALCCGNTATRRDFLPRSMMRTIRALKCSSSRWKSRWRISNVAWLVNVASGCQTLRCSEREEKVVRVCRRSPARWTGSGVIFFFLKKHSHQHTKQTTNGRAQTTNRAPAQKKESIGTHKKQKRHWHKQTNKLFLTSFGRGFKLTFF